MVKRIARLLLVGGLVATVLAPASPAVAASKWRGHWEGLTGQDLAVKFDVTSTGRVKNPIVQFRIGACGIEVEIRNFEKYRIRDGRFVARFGASSGGDITFKGHFTSRRRAEGKLIVNDYESPVSSCVGSVRTGWTARKGANVDEPPQSFTLTVNTSGTGTGTVTSQPTGINCPGDCQNGYQEGTQVTLTAVAAQGSTFTGWSGANCTGTGTCSVNMNANKSVTATFDSGGGGGGGNYAGSWSGTTGQGYNLSATVNSSNQITGGGLGWIGTSCEVVIGNATFDPPIQIQANGTFTADLQVDDPTYGTVATLTLAGTFTSDTAANGTLNVTGQGVCAGDSVNTTWSAAKTAFSAASARPAVRVRIR